MFDDTVEHCACRKSAEHNSSLPLVRADLEAEAGYVGVGLLLPRIKTGRIMTAKGSAWAVSGGLFHPPPGSANNPIAGCSTKRSSVQAWDMDQV